MSVARSDNPHYEVQVEADAIRPGVLLVCGYKLDTDSAQTHRTAAYLSSDGGKTWRAVLEVSDGMSSSEIACGIGQEGELYAAVSMEFSTKSRGLVIYRSTDGGASWSEAMRTAPWIDRKFMTIDRTNTESRGTVYLNGTGFPRSETGAGPLSVIRVFRSREQGTEFELAGQIVPPDGHYILPNGKSAVFSDGTLAIAFSELERAEDRTQGPFPGRHALLRVATSADRATTFGASVIVSHYEHCQPYKDNVVPALAVDQSRGPFRDRVYVAWAAYERGRCRILLASSSDRGHKWTAPVTVDDPPHTDATQRGPDAFSPVVAVNRRGVVGVSWHDRRANLPDHGWAPWFAASLDGGETFGASVAVSEVPYVPSRDRRWLASHASDHLAIARKAAMIFYAGDVSGLTADAQGTFHVAWIDNRGGVAQAWTAPVVVGGRAGTMRPR